MEQIMQKRQLIIVSDERSMKERRVIFSEQHPGSADGYLSSLECPSEVSDDDFVSFNGIESDDRGPRFCDLISDDEEDIVSCFDFLNSKQRILTQFSRVISREETFTASTSLKASKQVSFPSSELMKEARSTLWNLGLRVSALEPQILPTLAPKYMSRSKKSPRHPAIDVSQCEHLSAATWRSREQAMEKSHYRGTRNILNLPRTVFCEGQWMAQAIVWSAPTQQQKDSLDPGDPFLWKVISNPITQSLGLLPPTGISMENAIDIEEAVAISDEARVVSQSTPPFCVVYVNKAFLERCGIVSKDSIIGKPVESIIHVPDPSDIRTDSAGLSEKKSFSGRLGVKKDAVCRVSVTPVVDHNRKQEPTNPDSMATKNIVKHSGKFSCMSHILIQIT